MTATFLQQLAHHNNAQSYLEIGVQKGLTFCPLQFPHKVAVDPQFLFNVKQYASNNVLFYSTDSDSFFADEKYHQNKLFDLIYIDGLHTFAQSYKDLLGAMQHSHEKSIIVMDDTVPCDAYSAHPNQNESLHIRKQAGLWGKFWHGDTYKTIFSLHDLHPNYSWCTVMDIANPKTIIWQAENKTREKLFKNLEEINHLSYFDFLAYGHIFHPVNKKQVAELLWQNSDHLSLIKNNDVLISNRFSRWRYLLWQISLAMKI